MDSGGLRHGQMDFGPSLDRTHRYEPKVTRWKQDSTVPATRQARKATISVPQGQFHLLGLFAAAVFQEVWGDFEGPA